MYTSAQVREHTPGLLVLMLALVPAAFGCAYWAADRWLHRKDFKAQT